MGRNSYTITYGPTAGDCTSRYYIYLHKPLTVKEFIDTWVKDNPIDWGYFKISKYDDQVIELTVRYKKGRVDILNNKLDKSIIESVMNSTITGIGGSGGWSNSDFYIDC